MEAASNNSGSTLCKAAMKITIGYPSWNQTSTNITENKAVEGSPNQSCAREESPMP